MSECQHTAAFTTHPSDHVRPNDSRPRALAPLHTRVPAHSPRHPRINAPPYRTHSCRPSPSSSPPLQIRAEVREFMDDPYSSIAAMCFAVFVCIMIIVSVVFFCLETVDYYKQTYSLMLDKGEWVRTWWGRRLGFGKDRRRKGVGWGARACRGAERRILTSSSTHILAFALTSATIGPTRSSTSSSPWSSLCAATPWTT